MLKDNLFRVTLDTNANIIDFDEGASALSGYSPSDVLGKNWFETFIPEENLDEILAVFKGFLEGDLSFWEYQNKITCKDGSTHLVQWKNFLRRDSENNPVAIHSEGNLI
ncbi:PAS domain S-box protein [Campylobacterota bacterium]